jgi:hypothetical protein
MQQKITLTLLGACGMFLVRLLSVWIPLGPALERTYGGLSCGVRGGQGRDRTADLAVFSRVILVRTGPGSSACATSALLSMARGRLIIQVDPGSYGSVRIALAERRQNHQSFAATA